MPTAGASLSQVFGKNVRTRRKELKLSQEELAELLGISHQSLSRMEQGRIAPKFERLSDIAKHLGCSVPDLFISAPTPNRKETHQKMEQVLLQYGIDKEAAIDLMLHLISLLRQPA